MDKKSRLRPYRQPTMFHNEKQFGVFPWKIHRGDKILWIEDANENEVIPWLGFDSMNCSWRRRVAIASFIVRLANKEKNQ